MYYNIGMKLLLTSLQSKVPSLPPQLKTVLQNLFYTRISLKVCVIRNTFQFDLTYKQSCMYM